MIRTAICGTDSFSCALAEGAISNSLPVLLYDNNPGQLQATVQHIHDRLRQSVNDGLLTPGAGRKATDLLYHTTTIDECQADIIFLTEMQAVETAFEQIQHLAEINAPETIFIIRARWETLKSFPEYLPDPQRSCWLYVPENADDLVLAEIVANLVTSSTALLAVRKLVDPLGIRVLGRHDKPGFITGRIEYQRKLEMQYLINEGISDAEQITVLLKSAGFSGKMATPLSGKQWEDAARTMEVLGHALGDPDRFRLPKARENDKDIQIAGE